MVDAKVRCRRCSAAASTVLETICWVVKSLDWIWFECIFSILAETICKAFVPKLSTARNMATLHDKMTVNAMDMTSRENALLTDRAEMAVRALSIMPFAELTRALDKSLELPEGPNAAAA